MILNLNCVEQAQIHIYLLGLRLVIQSQYRYIQEAHPVNALFGSRRFQRKYKWKRQSLNFCLLKSDRNTHDMTPFNVSTNSLPSPNLGQWCCRNTIKSVEKGLYQSIDTNNIQQIQLTRTQDKNYILRGRNLQLFHNSYF